MEGQHQLGTDITVDSVHNITITANDSQSSSNPIITCSSPVGLWFSNSTSITITSIVINNCSNHGNTPGALAFYNISGVLTLDSLTVTNSNSRGIVMNKAEKVKIHECIFNSNGNGGMEMVDTQEIIIAKCSFIQNINTAKYGQGEGGGLKIKALSSTCPILSLIHSNFTNNTALYGGGLLIDIQCGNMTVSNSHFSYNTVQRLGGGIRVHVSNSTYHPNFTFIQSTFEYNTVLGKDILPGEPPAGGGVYIYLTAIKSVTTIKVIRCIFNNNNGHDYGGGVAVNQDSILSYKYPIDTIIERSLFQSNIANSHSWQNGGTIFFYASIIISYCKFINNTGICITHNGFLSNATIDNSIFSDNLESGLYSKWNMNNLLMINTSFERQQGSAINVFVYNFTLVNVSFIACSGDAVVMQCSIKLDINAGILSISISNLKILNTQGTGLYIHRKKLVKIPTW